MKQWLQILFCCCTLLGSSVLCRAQKPELVVQRGHGAGVTSAAYSSTRKQFASADSSGVIKLWDAETSKEIRTFDDSIAKAIHALSFSPNGKFLASAESVGQAGNKPDTGRVVVRDVKSGEIVTSIEYATSLSCVAFNPRGSLLAIGSYYSNEVFLWNVRENKRLNSLLGHDDGITGVAFSPDGRFLASASFDDTIKVWDTAVGKAIKNMVGHGKGFSSISYSPDGKMLASGGRDGTAQLWDATTGKKLNSFTGKAFDLTPWQRVAFSPQGKHLAVTRPDQVELWELGSGKNPKIFTDETEGAYIYPSSVAFGPDGQLISANADDSSPEILSWEIASGNLSRRITGHPEVTFLAAISRDGQKLALGDENDRGTFRIWDLVKGGTPVVCSFRTDLALHLEFDHEAKRLASTDTGGENLVRLWDVENGKELRTISARDIVIQTTFSPDSKQIAGYLRDRTIQLWDVETGRELKTFDSVLEVQGIAFSPDGKILASNIGSAVELWDIASGRKLNTFDYFNRADFAHLNIPNGARIGADANFTKKDQLAFNPNGKQLAAIISVGEDKIVICDVKSGQTIHTLKEAKYENGVSIEYSPNGRRLAVGTYDGEIKLYDVATGQEIRAYKNPFKPRRVAFGNSGQLMSVNPDNTVKIWDVESDQELCQFVTLNERDWAVVDSEGRLDASLGGMKQMHYVVGLEPIDLEQLKERYYEPGLLAKVLGFNKEPLRDVKAFDNVKLYPAVEVKPPAAGTTRAAITLENRGGGIGKVQVFINGVEVAADARGPQTNPTAPRVTIPFDLKDNPLLRPGEPNVIEVKAFNAEGYLSSRGSRLDYTPPGTKASEPPHLWAIVVGVSDYRGSTLDLRYAAKDAADFAKALEVGAKNVFPGRVHLSLLTAAPTAETSANTASIPVAEALPTRANLVKALQAARAAKPGDVLVVYLAGHGVNWGGQDGDYYYLTADAESGDLKDPAIRAATAISGKELSDLLVDIPALKRVLILDTCASGRLAESLSQERAVSSSVLRSWDRMKDRTGMFVLAGCAADAPSYEASRYGQGLLTYSLLQGIKSGEGLRDKQWMDVSTLFRHTADTVPELARGIGGVQRPLVAAKPEAGSFDIGRIESDDDRRRIPLPMLKPVVVRPVFQEEARPRDPLGLSKRMEDALREVSTRGAQAPLIFWDVPEYADAYAISGRYRVDGEVVSANVFLYQGEREAAKFTVMGEADKPDDLTTLILQKAQQILEKK